MRIPRPDRFIPRLFLALALVSCTTCVATGRINATSRQNPAPGDFETLAKSAAAARDAGKTDEAIRDYRKALEIHPNWEEGWWFLGTLQYDSDHYAEAVPAFQKLVGLAPKAGPAWTFLGLCEFETKDFNNALEHLRKGEALGAGDDPEIERVAKYHLALLLTRASEFEASAAALASTFGESQMSAQVKVALGLAMLRVPLLPEEVDPSRDALVLAAGQAGAAVAQGDSARALEDFASLLKRYPNIPFLHYGYGKALASAAHYEEALQEQRAETKISPRSALPWIEISGLELHLQQGVEAQHAAEAAVRLAPDSSAAHMALGRALQELSKKEGAEAELGAAEKLAPEKSVPDQEIARLYARGPEASRTGIQPQGTNQATPAESASFREFARHAAEAQNAGNGELAIQNYEQALQVRPDWDEGRWNLAMLYYSSAKYAKAIIALKSWVEHKPNFGTAWAVMALCEFELKDYGNAFIHLQRGADLGLGGSPEAVRLAKYRLAILLNHNSQFEKATEVIGPESVTGTWGKEMQFALGMALLRMPMLPEDVEPSKSKLVQSAGEVASLLQNSKYDLAFPRFQALLKDYPTTAFLHYAYGTALAALSQYDEAETQLRKETQISPTSELPYVRLASLALKRRRPADALPDANRAVQLAHDSAEAHYILGRAYLETGDGEMAVQELEIASKLAPTSPEVHFNLAKAYAKVKMQDKAEQERAIFARLNELAEKQRSQSGSQAYGGSHDAVEFSPTRIETNKDSVPQRP
jgi:tetratricopeptide (TPR) repeat protein